MELGLVFDRQRRQLDVIGEVSGSALAVQEVEGDVEVAWSGQQKSDLWACEPVPDVVDGVGDGEWDSQDARVRGDADEAEQRRRAQADLGGCVEGLLLPDARSVVLGKPVITA